MRLTTRRVRRPRSPQRLQSAPRPPASAAPSIGRGPATQRPRPRYVTLNGATMVTIAAVALSIIGMLYLVQTAHVAGLGYELSRIEQRRDELAIENARLGYEIARYESLDTIQEIAVQQLGMTPLTRYQFLRVEQPRREQLTAPAPPPVPAESLWQRIERAIAGVGRAHAPAQGTPALPADWEGN